jgi:predicted TIM-barrel fold metal-dependent hydrolase
MAEHTQPALRQPTAPHTRAPEGATDCHFHIFGPYNRFPLSAGRSYSPVEASLGEYRQMAGVLGLGRQVVVQPSVYGTDNRCTLDAVAQFGLDQARAIVVVEDVTDGELQAMHRKGARGIRCNAVNANGMGMEKIQALAGQIAPLGWHLQLYIAGERLPSLLDTLLALPTPVVIDHMGQMPPGESLDGPAFQALLRLLSSGKGWVKLCAYRSSGGPPYADMAAQARAMIAAAPDRCVWGTDWPHPNLEGRAMPDDGMLLDCLTEWAGDAATLRRILVDNPARLYGFA